MQKTSVNEKQTAAWEGIVIPKTIINSLLGEEPELVRGSESEPQHIFNSFAYAI